MSRSLFSAAAVLTTTAEALLAGELPCLDWQLIYPEVTPPARNAGSMVYDEARGVTLLYGGSVGAQSLLGDMWQWDGASWLEIELPAINPGPRSAAMTAYDHDAQKVYLFGGFVRESGITFTKADLWSWDGATWTLEWEANGATPQPHGRSAAGFAYDSRRRKLVLHAGYLFGSDYMGYLSDLWEWDGQQWSQRTQGPNPGLISGHDLFFDAENERMLMVGRRRSATGDLCDFWAWDGDAWTQLSDPAPTARGGANFGFDRLRQRAVLAGGFLGSTYLHDAWVWEGAHWTRLNTSPMPSILSAANSSDADGALLMFGGYDRTFPGTSPTTQLWRLGPAPLLGDIDGDHAVGMSDLMAVVDAINTTGAHRPEDVNNDGHVNFADLNIVVSNYNRTCP